MAYYGYDWAYTFDNRHGFGIQFGTEEAKGKFTSCFYEDGTLEHGEYLRKLQKCIDEMRRYGYYVSGKRDDSVTVSTEDGRLIAKVRTAYGEHTVTVSEEGHGWTNCECSCGRRSCSHMETAGLHVVRRLWQLQHTYVVSEKAVDKSLFLESRLENAVSAFRMPTLEMGEIEKVRDIIGMVREAKNDRYYLNFHELVLDQNDYYGYEPHLMETKYRNLLLGAFEDPGYKKAVLDSDEFAGIVVGGGKQYRSNRASVKRLLKEYEKTVKQLEKGSYEENGQKEFLLKYRADWTGLLRFFGCMARKINDSDLPFLEKILEAQEVSFEKEFESVRNLAVKLDAAVSITGVKEIFAKFMERLTPQMRIDTYALLRNMSMTAEDIRTLSREDQLKMVRNTPLSADTVRYILSDLMAGESERVRGNFVFYVLSSAFDYPYSVPKDQQGAIGDALLEEIRKLPDSRLLHAYVKERIGREEKRKSSVRKKDPIREIGTYFACSYEIVRRERSMYVTYSVRNPETNGIIMALREEDGQVFSISFSDKYGYTPEEVRSVCLHGHEEEYRREFEKTQDNLAAAIFEKEHIQFASAYRTFCASVSDEKILYVQEGKVGIEWQIFWEDDQGALSFKVGGSRMYVVKDALEFLKAFRTSATMEYGKDLILTHDPENLRSEDAALIRQLMTASVTRGRPKELGSRRYITMGEAMFGTILEGLKGREVTLNGEYCLVRLAPQKAKVHMNESYVPSSVLPDGTELFMNLLGHGYLLMRGEKGDRFLDRVDAGVDEVNLLQLIHDHPSVSIRPILKDFRKNVYARFFEMFDVDPAIQRDFALSQIRLNTYFDFEKGTITAKTKVLRDDKEIRPEQLTDRIDRVKMDLLENYLQALGFQDGVMEEESRVLNFFKMDFTRLKTLTNVYLSENLQNKELRSIGRPVVRVMYKSNLVQVFLEKSEFTEAELEQIIAGLRKKKKYILLGGNRIVDLDSEAARDFGETVQDFEMDPKDLYRKKTISMVNAIKAFSHERSCRVDKYLRDMIEEIRSFKEAEIDPPQMKEAELRDYQTEGFRWLSILSKYGMGGILADDMGLGKTIQMLALLKSDRTRKPSLVVCPKSLIFNWLSEFARFDGTTRVQAIYGPDSQRKEIIAGINGKEKTVYVTSYESLRNDISSYTVDFNYVILDEAQYIKNVHALKTKSVKELKAAHRFALTGTPIENSVVDLWSIFDFIMPGYFEELSRFRESETQAIAKKAAPFILRRVKEDVLEDLPPKYERILSADMSEGQRKLYDAMRQEAKKALAGGGKAFDLLPYLTRLRQVCVNPGMFVEDYRGGSGKMDLLADMIPEYLKDHHRILIFSQFVKALEGVEKMLSSKGIPTYFLSGATPAKDRVEMMDSFNNGSGTDVFLISLKAGGTGLNLTGADTVIHLDPWWNVAAENQASDRTHRIGQTRNVEVIRLIAADSIEQRVVELQDMKKEVIRQVISDDDGSVTSASLEDIAFVLE